MKKWAKYDEFWEGVVAGQQLQGESKKTRHYFPHPTYNLNNSKTVCPICLKIAVRRVLIGDSSHIKFQGILTNRFRVITVRSWKRKKVSGFF